MSNPHGLACTCDQYTLDVDAIPARSEDVDLAVRDFMRQAAENLSIRLPFTPVAGNPANGSEAMHPAGEASYHIRRTPDRLYIASIATEGDHKETLYRGPDPAAAVAWCRLHATFGGSANAALSARAKAEPVRILGACYMMLDPADESWRLITAALEDLGAWDLPIQADIVARAHIAVS